jgi:DNA polymerase-1
MRTLLIDADLLLYRAAAATEFEMGVEIEGSEDEDLFVRVGSLNDGIAAAEAEIARLKSKLQATDVVLCLTGKDNFRKDIWPTYKANRTGARPVCHAILRKAMKARHRHYERNRLEADDVMGILATHAGVIRGEKIVVSEDKDMLQLTGIPIFRQGQIVVPDDGDRYHLLQTLQGDLTDNYPGCPKVGEKTAEKIIPPDMPIKERWPAVVMAYAKAGLSDDYALTMARVARILTADHFNFETKEVLLWNPA